MSGDQDFRIRVHGFKATYEMRPVKGDPETDKCDDQGYKLDAKDHRITKLQEEIWVTYSPAHSVERTVNTERVRFLYPDPAKMGSDQDGKKLAFMTARWAQIGPAFEAFKAGKEIPINGTPLGAWSGISPEQAEVLRQNAIRTVEEVADLVEGQMDRIRLPNMRELRNQARLFLENSDAAAAAAREAEKDAVIAEMAERLAKMESLLESATSPKAEKGKAKEAA